MQLQGRKHTSSKAPSFASVLCVLWVGQIVIWANSTESDPYFTESAVKAQAQEEWGPQEWDASSVLCNRHFIFWDVSFSDLLRLSGCGSSCPYRALCCLKGLSLYINRWGHRNETGKKVQLFVNCEFAFALFSSVLFCYSSGWLRTLVLLAANHVLKANSIKNQDAKQLSGRFRQCVSQRNEEFFQAWEKFLHKEDAKLKREKGRLWD